jgi:metal-dependent amidase/aminoacylase/carboxypeptidase family protein
VGETPTDNLIIHPIHSPNFDIDEEALKTSVVVMSWIAVNALSEE